MQPENHFLNFKERGVAPPHLRFKFVKCKNLQPETKFMTEIICNFQAAICSHTP
ncbi:hypothetical protein QDY71_04065 [Kingella negevensis]|uniref:hypothetical protein n=1 Tax=Kingella negevensis TaxID=1522312 RepID=UPI00254A1DEC|nr:hypothetical protein [Kingella negevensis]MDK4684616.1 hypothetical protein [Kingella negevensis]MDK4696945.1 hypothetical protein [Kingella negevensis]MDK4708125.1 hypothetical protein [Kingella negevensis]MDK4709690.1 hypothetical protein [Kingella negevensis]